MQFKLNKYIHNKIVLQKINFGADNVQRYKPRYNPFDPCLPNQRGLTQNI